MSKNPRVSVVMPAYNAEKFIGEAVESILNQTYADFELIIIDDGSTDQTAAIVRSFKDDRIRLMQNGVNLKITKSLLRGWDAAKGEYIIRADSDDINLPERFFEQVQFMDTHKDVDICGSWLQCFGVSDEIVRYLPEHNDIQLYLMVFCCIGHPTVIMRKKSFETHGLGYDEKLVYCEDYDLWVRSRKLLRFANIQKVLVKYRLLTFTKSIQKDLDSKSDEIRFRQIIELLPECSEADKKTFYSIITLQFERNPIFLKEACAFLIRMSKANKVQKIYDQKALYAFIIQNWLYICNLYSKSQLVSWPNFWKATAQIAYLSPSVFMYKIIHKLLKVISHKT